ncbi:transmembrane protein 14C-like protein [Gorgonomyces haynaldii]|nr:transmembrane protein 14C-like protein [Gorgonomyces haynaldii]
MDIFAYLYGLLVLFGGVMGYIRKDSVVSLVAGSVFGSLILYSARIVSKNPRNYQPMLGMSFLLMTLSSWRFSVTGAMMPMFYVSIISLLFVLRYSLRAYFE